ncbi:hypothetical protein EZL74_07015 [Flavobacterium silvisoli]|uniref:Carbohydrate kinase PfkB domain-containing protein n=1 Tax=Flavobacterium silvisoli TaxID=2529433 RepID=A0A4Q9Z6E7_9FLAO|nr:PfkB family carbohydrate kinase [Flavobacterium silvisoli]TBX69621.1 hypothetical protein EZL74_07015 [Flavobacterium silvisoli]
MISVIGGTYREIDYDDVSLDIYGSGYRCCKFLLENKCIVNYHTSGNDEVENYLNEVKKVYSNFSFKLTKSEDLVTFKYSFALDTPNIFPNILNIKSTDNIKVDGDNIICYGMLESEFNISGKKVIYDPQTSLRPKKYSEFGIAEELIYIVNMNEAKSISSQNELEEIKKYFFNNEKAYALIIKNGPHGAKLYLKSNEEIDIPSFITKNVNKIGSGDIFTSSFGYYWMNKKLPLKECAILASKATSLYCDKKVYIDVKDFEYDFIAYEGKNLKDKQVYIAAPFFSLAELILIDKIRNAFLEFGVKVFSPFHDIGFGDDEAIAIKDLQGIKDSDIIFCVFDNLDSGTLIESGFSIAMDKKIIGYHRTCEDSKLLMLKPGNLKVFKNLTTAMYHTIWNL